MSIKPYPEPFAALIFDCDGTLVNTCTLHYQAISKVLDAYGLHIPEPWFQAHAGKTLTHLLQVFQRERQITLDIEALTLQSMRFYHEGLDNLQEIETIASIARQYKGVVPMAVASNGHRDLVTASLEKTGLLALFDTVVTIDDIPQGKPAPDLFLEAARRLNVLPGQCFVFEDSDEGLEAASRAKIPACDVRNELAMQTFLKTHSTERDPQAKTR